MGERQLRFLVEQGLAPTDHLLDIGCGALRAGVHFVRYLEPGRYHGLDIDAQLLDAGRRELAAAGLDPADADLVADDAFRFGRFGRRFSWALAQSVFTHLPANRIMRCLAEAELVLEPGGRLFATYFPSGRARLATAEQRPAPDVVTHLDADPFHYDTDVFRWMVEESSLEVEPLGAWDHPRNQHMLVFTKR